MIRDGFITTLQRRLTRVRQAACLADAQFWATGVLGMTSAGFLLGALSFEERDRLDDLIANAQNTREAELRAQEAAA